MTPLVAVITIYTGSASNRFFCRCGTTKTKLYSGNRVSWYDVFALVQRQCEFGKVRSITDYQLPIKLCCI
ncbi:hypothetical protein [Microcoleus sp. CAWBG58]|uniref:hypothetical protein n=1 Tax=Microcoleus sp. CAWBG58 TaxID=2841651 RepID=UPI0025FB8A46|nr:hypothetical protein [Microcoleus sp. CAWBG58]